MLTDEFISVSLGNGHMCVDLYPAIPCCLWICFIMPPYVVCHCSVCTSITAAPSILTSCCKSDLEPLVVHMYLKSSLVFYSSCLNLKSSIHVQYIGFPKFQQHLETGRMLLAL